MKHRIQITLAAAGLAAMFTFTNCQKDLNRKDGSAGENSLSAQTYAGREAATADRLDAIVKDLSLESYSLSFDKPISNAGITRTAYGADNYFAFADPQDLICGTPIIRRFPRVPIWKRPNFIQPTCPDMAIDVNKFKQIQEFLVNSDPSQFAGLKGIKISNGGALFATEKFTRSYASMQLDKLDDLLADLDATKFVLLSGPDVVNRGAFTRNFYGYADLNAVVFKKYKTNLKDIIKPTLKGCFDPLILKVIRERLVKFNPDIYKGLVVNPLEQDRTIGTLSF